MHLDAHPIFLILALPLLGVLINGFFGKWTGKQAGWISSFLVLGAFVVALVAMLPAVQEAVRSGLGYRDFLLYDWLDQDPNFTGALPALRVPFAVRADPLSMMMVFVV